LIEENSAVPVFEPASQDTFSAECYLLANADVQEFVRSGGDAAVHFREWGHAETRRQVSRQFYSERLGEHGRAKFKRFAHVIDATDRTAVFVEGKDRFPIVLSDRHYSREDYVHESAHSSFAPFLAEMQANPSNLYLDLGCGLRDKVLPNCLYLEVYPSLTADVIVGTDCTYPIRTGSLDGIGCFAVLEHTQKPWLVAEEMHRMLKPGGSIFVEWPFLQPLHGYPSHFFNATREGLRSVFSEGFEVSMCTTLPSHGPDWTIDWVLGEFSRRLPEEKRQRLLAMTVGDLLTHRAQSPFWQDLLQGLPDDVLSEFACGNSLIARKL